MTDWPTTVTEFESLFGDRRTHRQTGLRGANFMTPEILGNVLVAGEPVEISTGSGFDHDRIFGVTFPRDEAGGTDDRSRMCCSLREVYDFLYGDTDDS